LNLRTISSPVRSQSTDLPKAWLIARRARNGKGSKFYPVYERITAQQTELKAFQAAAKAREIRRRVLGPEHSETLESMNNLAVVYEDQRKYVQAEVLFRQTLEVKHR
jgi:Tetratricopeptide repeat